MKRTVIAHVIVLVVLAIAALPVLAATPETNTISESNAKQIALDAAGFKENQVTFTKARLDTENGSLKYEIDFNKGKYEYDYDIDARTGVILNADKELINENAAPAKEIKKDKTATTKAKDDKITQEEALDIALKDAGFTPEKISDPEVRQENAGGINKYEVEFHVGNKEYSYDIAVKDGRILEHEAEIDG